MQSNEIEKKKYQLFLNMIVAEDEPVEMLKRAINSLNVYLDGIFITITYSNKKPSSKNPLVKLLKQYRANITYFKWVDDFAQARQFALDRVPKGTNKYVIWIDVDDVFRGAEKLPQIMNDALLYNHASIFFPYWYMVEADENGNVKEIIIEHKRERIIRNDDTWRWVGSLHETLIEQRHENLLRIGRSDCVVVHLSNPTRSDRALERNIKILEQAVRREQHKDPRTIIYLAKAYFDKGKLVEMPERKIFFDLSLTLFHEYLNGSGVPGTEGYRGPSGWREERSTAWGHVGDIAILSGHPEVAVNAFQSAIDEAEEFPKYYVDLAMAYCMIGEFRKARHWLNIASHIPMPNTTIITFPKELKQRALQVSLEVNMKEGKLQFAKEDAEKLLAMTPEDVSCKNNLDTINTLIEFNQACQSIVYVGKYLEKKGDSEKLVNLIRAIPSDMQGEKFVSEMRHKFMPIKIWGQNEITVLCGPGFEKWSPKSIETGVGGSEEAIIYMSQELVKLGWKVTVYADPREDAGEYEGVSYRPWYEMNPKDIFSVLLLWRSVGFIDFNPQAKFIGLLLHDVPSNPEFTEERVNKIDKIFVLSNYHKSLLRLHKDGKFLPMPENKVFLTANGLPDFNIEKDSIIKRDPHKIIYASSYDRGLINLLLIWPEIKKEIPNATLEIFYGWNLFNAIHRNNPAQMKWREQIQKMMKQSGITDHGRVSHQQLEEEFMKSAVWAYPSTFEEIFCTTAARAQRAGAIPVVIDAYALSETVKNGYKIDTNIQTDEGRKEYYKHLIELLKNEEKQEEIRSPMMKWAKEYFPWKRVSENWDKLFRIKLQSPEKKNEIKTEEEFKSLEKKEVDNHAIQ